MIKKTSWQIMVYFYNQQITPSLTLDADNLGLLRGYSAFEYIRTYHKKLFCLKAHLLRFLFSMEKMHMKCPYSLEELEAISNKLIAHEQGECGLKWIATGGKSPSGLTYQGPPEIFAFTLPMKALPSKLYKEGIFTETLRAERPLPEAKTTAYLAAVERLSIKPHLHEILYVNAEGDLLEAATSNLFVVKQRTLYTPSVGVLHGITRQIVLELAKPHYPLEIKKISYSDLALCDEVFVTATNKEILPVCQVDDLKFKIGPMTSHLRALFEKMLLQTTSHEFIPPLYQRNLATK